MNTTFTENLTDESIDTLLNSEFTEFCFNIKSVEDLLEDHTFYYEAVQDNNRTMKKVRSNIKQATMATNSQLGGVYANTTDAGGAIIKTAWNVAIQACLLGSKLIKFICQRTGDLPRYIGNIGRKVGEIPQGVKAKINGDIKLYITAGDIENLYKMSLFKRIDQYLSYAQILSHGDFWGTWFFNKRKDDNGKKQNDLKLCDNMMKVYHQLQNVTFEQTTISMKDKNNVELYFGNAGSCSFRDLDNNVFKGTYYQALGKLLEDLHKDTDKLKEVDELLHAKEIRTTEKNTIGNLNPRDRSVITNMLNQTSKVISIVANIIKCVMADTKEIESAVDMVIRSSRRSGGASVDQDTINSIQTEKEKEMDRRMAAAKEKQAQEDAKWQ